MKYDYLIVGSGLYGSTFAHAMKQAGKSCLVIDKRNHTGGNVWCKEMVGIQVHMYGAHIFHTNDDELWQFVNKFVPFKPFINSPKAKYHNQVFSLPFNMNTFKELWGIDSVEQAKEKLRQDTLPFQTAYPKNLKEQALSTLGPDIFEKLIKHYTEKQWGKPCDELPAFLIKRVPLRFEFDNNYFNDTYQGIPSGGYNKLVDGLLQGIEVRTGIDYLQDKTTWDNLAHRVVYTGKIDAFFDYQLGELQYRSLRFEHKLMQGVSNFQHNAVFNYTSSDVPYTRVVEHKHFDWVDVPDTVVSYEYPQAYKRGEEAYYPVNDEKNNACYAEYKKISETLPHIIFGGRLAEYKYYDMHQVIAAALHKAKKLLQHGE